MPPPQLLVFYDGGCPLCRREIEHYMRVDAARRIDWLDIARHPEALADHGIRLEEAMARLHVRAAGGEVATGAHAFARIWDALPGYRWLARVLRAVHALPLLDRAYGAFAAWRYRRRCSEGACASPAPRAPQ